MVDFTAQELREVMDRKKNIRNMAVIGHLSHGKSTLTNSLVAAAGNMRQEGAVELPMTDTSANVGDPGISIRSTGISLLFDLDDDTLKAYKGGRYGNKYIINLIDTPGHVDFSAEATAALHITDGALVVVDSLEGICLQTETLLRQAISERTRPVLCLNKMDRLFSGLQVGGAQVELDGEQAYTILLNVIDNTNQIMEAACVDARLQVHPQNGTVAFSSGIHGWAFTLTGFARKYASKYGMDESLFAKQLWGEHFYDSTRDKWFDSADGSAKCTRGFVHFCYKPIRKIIKLCMKDDKGKLWDLCRKLGVRLRDDDKRLLGEDLYKCVMQTWLPTNPSLHEMMVFCFPSPLQAQKNCVKRLYQGPPDDKYGKAISNCDPDGPLMFYISKVNPTSDAGRFFTFGRIFSGRIATGMKVRIMGPSHVPGLRNDVYVKLLPRSIVVVGKNQQGIDDVPCGNTIGVICYDECIMKSTTVTGEMEVDAWPIKAKELFVPHVLFLTVKCKVPSDTLQLRHGLNHLTECDLAVLCGNGESCGKGESGSFTVACVGELHLEMCLKDLKRIMNGVEVAISSPIVSHRENVLDKPGDPVKTLSQNKNSISLVARPLDDELVEAIDNGLLSPYTDHAVRSETLAEYGWDDQLKIWCFGPEAVGPNMVVDRCSELQYPELVKNLVVAGFKLASQEGALAKEKLRGICFEVHEVSINADDALRGARCGQLVKMVKKAFVDSQLAAKPMLLEPVYRVAIQCPPCCQWHL